MAKLSFKDFLDDQPALAESVERTDEALNMAQRRKRSIQMKKFANRLKVGRKKASMKVANAATLNKRARKAARNAIAKKLTHPPIPTEVR